MRKKQRRNTATGKSDEASADVFEITPVTFSPTSMTTTTEKTTMMDVDHERERDEFDRATEREKSVEEDLDDQDTPFKTVT